MIQEKDQETKDTTIKKTQKSKEEGDSDNEGRRKKNDYKLRTKRRR